MLPALHRTAPLITEIRRVHNVVEHGSWCRGWVDWYGITSLWEGVVSLPIQKRSPEKPLLSAFHAPTRRRRNRTQNLLSHCVYNPTTPVHRATTTPHASDHSASQGLSQRPHTPTRTAAFRRSSFFLLFVGSRRGCGKVWSPPAPTTCRAASSTAQPPQPKHSGLSPQLVVAAAVCGLPCKTAPSTRRRGW